MPAAYVSHTYTAPTGTTTTISRPAGATSAHTLVALVFSDYGTDTIDTSAAPSGWTAHAGVEAAATPFSARYFSAPGDVASLTFNTPDTNGYVECICASGTLQTGHSLRAIDYSSADGADDNVPTPSIPTAADDLVVSIYAQLADGAGSGAIGTGYQAGYTRQYLKDAAYPKVSILSRESVSAGTSGTVSHDATAPYANRFALTLAFAAAGGGGVSASGAVAPVSLSAPDSVPSVSRIRAGAVDDIGLSAPAAGFSVNRIVSGSVAPISLSAPDATAFVSRTGEGAVAPITLSAPAAGSSVSRIRSGAVDDIGLSAPSGAFTVSRIRDGAVAPISLSAAEAGFTVTRVAAGSVAALSLSPPAADFSTPSAGASGPVSAVTLTAPEAAVTVSRIAVGSVASITLVPTEAAVTAGTPVVDVPHRDYSYIRRATRSFSGAVALSRGRRL